MIPLARVHEPEMKEEAEQQPWPPLHARCLQLPFGQTATTMELINESKTQIYICKPTPVFRLTR